MKNNGGQARGQNRQRAPAPRPVALAASSAANDEGIDFDITLNNSRPEQDADSTVRPNLKPTDKVGAKFEPFDVPYRPFEVLELPETPLKLFQRFLPIWLVQNWVNYTNNTRMPRTRSP
ncbi:hypothetical protein S40285_09133 [Stachybotrys chlorohalonatus IBT 40285]|uniref:Uncharacterized protein n=1 Tax=Stachybotrys chlorohalonatus (strain IBT 40285) TaxID=1283841 RepID=A0A084QZG8_STAC4|nr:hypothetical protein S40285_09133 [Stachybotrys chlorohalonata IBT 40285]